MRKILWGDRTLAGALYDVPSYRGVSVEDLSLLIRKARDEARSYPTTYTQEGGGPKYLNSFPDGSLREKVKELIDRELGNIT